VNTIIKPSSIQAMLLGVVCAVGLVACNDHPTINPKTTAPPGATAEYFESRSTDGRTIRLTAGLAFALECADAKGRPCSFDGTTIKDGEIASVKKAYADLDQKLVSNPGTSQTSYRNRMVFVVVGKKAGTTELTLVTGYGDKKINIEVVAPN
jgi:hypothetical protein